MKELTLNTTLIPRRRPLMPTLNLLLAGGAAVLAVIAIAADDVASTTPTSTTPAVTVVGSAHPLGAVSAGIPCNELVYTRC
jgi:hypothetical protein